MCCTAVLSCPRAVLLQETELQISEILVQSLPSVPHHSPFRVQPLNQSSPSFFSSSYISVKLTVSPTTKSLYYFFLVLLFLSRVPSDAPCCLQCSFCHQVPATGTAPPPAPTPSQQRSPCTYLACSVFYLFASCSPETLSASSRTKTDTHSS